MKIVETGKDTTSENPRTIKITDKENLAVISFHGCHTFMNLSLHITHNSKFEKITVAGLIISIKRQSIVLNFLQFVHNSVWHHKEADDTVDHC